MSSSEALTDGVRVEVEARYSPSHSAPHRNAWFFLYTVRITNERGGPVQLLMRHWIISDATGKVEEVRGDGVVGEQPVLEPGEAFEYTSGCPLRTPFGAMRGSYRMVADDGEELDVQIAEFALREPGAIH
jgi:ApaG protein